MRRQIIKLSFILATATPFISTVHAQKWTEWEHQNSIARAGAFLVIKQPDESFCYVKQGFDGEQRIELHFKHGEIRFIHGYYRGFQGELRYWVDKREEYRIARDDLGTSISADPNLIEELKAGYKLFISVHPIGAPRHTEILSLIGFTASTEWTKKRSCTD